MAELVLLPKMGLTAKEATVTAWLVDVGASVESGEVLCEIETDKISNEVEAPVSGVLLRRVDAGVVVPVGAGIAVIGAPGEDAPGLVLFGDEEAAPVAARRPVSPAARRRAEELGMALDGISGSGPGGRITIDDVEAAAGGEGDERGPSQGPRREQPSRLRRAVAAAMTRSAAVPQFALEREVDVTALEERVRAAADRAGGQRPTVADAIAVALARALAAHPRFLRSWDDGELIVHDEVRLGVAVALDDGLVVPVVGTADRLDAGAFAAARRGLQEAARAGRLPADAFGGVFTLSNLGPFGIDRFQALVNPPESGILALGRIREVQGRRLTSLTLSADHRVVDGADGARLLATIVAELEHVPV